MRVAENDLNVEHIENDYVFAVFNQTTNNEPFSSKPSNIEHHRIFFIEQGKCTFYLNNEIYSLTKFDALFIPQNTSCEYKLYNHTNIFCVSFNGFEKLFTTTKLPNNKPIHFNNVNSCAPQLFMLYDKILCEISLKQIGYDSLISSYLSESLVLLARQYLNQVLYNLADPKFTEIRPALLKICNDYVNALSLKDYASLCNLSVSSFSHKFKHITGLTPIEYLNQIRIFASTALLTDTNYSVNSISELVGFSSYTYFSKLFKRKFNMTATHYRHLYQTK